MDLREHQKVLVSRCLDVLKSKHLCYLAAEERVGKSLVALDLIYQLCELHQIALILTKKKALEGWLFSIAKYRDGILKSRVLVTNYEQVSKLTINPSFVILDEAHHGIGAYPRYSKTAGLAQKFAYDANYVLLLSATPHAESYSQLFHQFNISRFSPFDHYRDFYAWFKDYGIPEFQWVGGRQIRKYNDTQVDKIKEAVEPYFVRMSRREAGFDFEPIDHIHLVELSDIEKSHIETLKRTRVLELETKRANTKMVYEADTPTKLISALHQLEGGTLKFDKKGWYIWEAPKEQLSKVNYILDNWGDTNDLAIFYNYVAEGDLLRKYFKNALILQGTSYAEGIDLSHIRTLVIYSQNFSASKYIQRKARQCNYDRKEPIHVHFLLAKGEISDMVYESVAKKQISFTSVVYLQNTEICK